MINKISRKCMVSGLQELVLLMVIVMTRSELHQQPTLVPGSEQLVVRTEFPYEYWRPSKKMYSPLRRQSQVSTPASYGFYYGDSRKDQEVDASSWQMLPIQLPDDLVGAVNERSTVITAPTPTYPTAATPQYGRYPGVTEHPHLFHPERLYKGSSRGTLNVNAPQYPNHRYPSQDDHSDESYQIPGPELLGDHVVPWHQGIFDRLQPFSVGNFPQIPKLPKFPTITRLPTWPFGDAQTQERITQSPEDFVNDIEEDESQQPYQLFSIPGIPSKRRRGDKRRNRPYDDRETIIFSTPPNQGIPSSEGEKVVDTNGSDDDMQPYTEEQNTRNEHSLLNHPFQYIKKKIRPMPSRQRIFHHRRRPIRRKYFQNRPPHKQRFSKGQANRPWEAQLFLNQNDDPSMLNSDPNNFQGGIDRTINNRYHPHIQNLPDHKQRPHFSQISNLKSSQDQSLPYSQRPSTPIRNRRPALESNPVFGIDEAGYEYDLIDRLSDANPLTPSVAMPGGLLIVALALAIFYFNFVWYPTPVVTARLIKIISESVPDNVLDSQKQKAIGEVYEVFRSLETEYLQDPNLWQPSCKSRLVCQVHQEIPALWQITQSYEVVVRNSLATGPHGDNELSSFLRAAENGNQGSDCENLFKSCPMAPIPIRSSLQKWFGISDGHTIPTIIYS